MWLVFQILSFPYFLIPALQTRMDCTVAVMHTRKCACGLDRIGFFLHCFEFSQFRKKYPSHVPFTTFAGMFTWELRLKFVLIWIQSSLMPFCLVCATPGLALKSVRFLVMNDDCFTIQHQPRYEISVMSPFWCLEFDGGY